MENAPYVLTAMKMGAQNWDTIKNPAQKRIDKARGRGPVKDPDLEDTQTMEEKGYVLKRRSQVSSDEEIVETVRHKGQQLPRRPRARRQTSSVDAGRRYQRDRGGNGSDSEGSIPPRSRRARSVAGRSRRGRGSSSSSSSSSSSELGSSTDEEKEMKKMKRKKWLTAGLASVATIHAASKVYSSIEKHDKRVIDVQAGAISPEEAHKQARSARWQDAAAIGIAALGIKGAMSEWKEMTEEHEKHKELMEKHEEMHRRRIEHLKRQKARQNGGGYYKGRDGQWYYDGPDRRKSGGSSSRPGSASTWNTYDQLAGPRQNERKMIEAPPQRSRSVWEDDRSRSRARSVYGRDDDSNDRDRSPVRKRSPSRNKQHCSRCNHVANNPLALSALAAPFLAAGAYKLTKAEIADEPILKHSPEKQKYLEKYKSDQKGEYKDFLTDGLEEVLGKL